MIYIQLNSRVRLTQGQPLRLRDAARVTGKFPLADLPLPCPQQPGVWRLRAIDVARAVQSAHPDASLTLLGADVCYVHRAAPKRRDLTRPLRQAAALLILGLGGALGLAWFHADVDMPRAQLAVYEALTGHPPRDVRLITVPYAAGVALGVAVFYALPTPSACTPLELRAAAYQAELEKAEGQDID